MILASQSPRRIELMREAGFDVRVIPADIDETALPGEGPFELVERHDGVGGHDPLAWLGVLVGHDGGLCAGKALDQLERAFSGKGGLIYVCGDNADVEARFAHELDAPG